MNNVAVIMSVYEKDNPKHLVMALDSIINQSYKNWFLYIAVDGPVPDSIKVILIDYQQNTSNVTVHYHNSNLGLAYRLNELIDEVADNYKYIARMDADDVSAAIRLDKQVKYLDKFTDIGVLGSSVNEMDALGQFACYKSMETEHEILSSNILKKCPFNHPTVMFRSKVFRDGYRYKNSLKNTQDYYLWVDLLAGGIKFANIDEALLNFRVNSEFYSRRGVKKALNDFKARLYAGKKLDISNMKALFFAVLIYGMRVSPAFVKKLLYRFAR